MNPAVFGSLPASACTASTAGSFGADRISKRGYDAVDRPTSITAAYGTSAAQTITLTYSDNGKLSSYADGKNNLTTYAYDGFDRLSQTMFPSPTVPGTSSTIDYEQQGYDPNGNLTNRRLRDGSSIAFTWDYLNRLTFKDLPGTEPDVTYGYDNLDQMTSASQTGVALSFGYDALGRRVSEEGPAGKMISQWDAAGRRTRLTWPDTFYVTYDYDGVGELTAIRENGATAGVGVLATLTYDDLGRRTGLMRGNGTSTSYGYDTASRLTGLSHDLAGTSKDLAIALAGYNPAGQIGSRTSSNDSYAWTQAVNAATAYAADGLNRYTSWEAVSPVYDARGNLTDAGGATFGYSSQNLLVSATGSIGLSYDGLNRLFQVTGGGSVRFGYDDADKVAEYSTANVLQRRYVFGPGTDEPLVWYEGASTTDRRWLYADERGSVIATADGGGNVTGINSYDGFGVPASSNTGRFQYTGQAWIGQVRLYDFKARFYMPTLGRFMQTDPIGYDAGANLYNYGDSDPINQTDPTGLDACARGPCHTEQESSSNNNEVNDTDTIVVTGKRQRPPPPRPPLRTNIAHIPTSSVGDNTGKTQQKPQKSIWDRVKDFGCSLPNIDIGFGGDFYAGLGGSLGGSFKLDIASGQVGAGFSVAVGAGLGAEAGPSVAVSPSGSGIVSANVTVSGGGGLGVGVVGTRNIIGTDPGQTSVSVGRVGTPIGFVNGGAAAGFNTPKTNPLGCKSK